MFIKKQNAREVKQDVEGDHLPCCKSSASDLSETSAVICLTLNVAYPGFGTIISGFVDRKGCNATAFWTGVLQAILSPVFLIGYVWGIWHMWLTLRSIRSAESKGEQVENSGTGNEQTQNLIQ